MVTRVQHISAAVIQAEFRRMRARNFLRKLVVQAKAAKDKKLEENDLPTDEAVIANEDVSPTVTDSLPSSNSSDGSHGSDNPEAIVKEVQEVPSGNDDDTVQTDDNTDSSVSSQLMKEHQAATTIQCKGRQILAKQISAKLTQQKKESAAILMEKFVRTVLARVVLQRIRDQQAAAATTAQSAGRRWIACRRLYHLKQARLLEKEKLYHVSEEARLSSLAKCQKTLEPSAPVEEPDLPTFQENVANLWEGSKSMSKSVSRRIQEATETDWKKVIHDKKTDYQQKGMEVATSTAKGWRYLTTDGVKSFQQDIKDSVQNAKDDLKSIDWSLVKKALACVMVLFVLVVWTQAPPEGVRAVFGGGRPILRPRIVAPEPPRLFTRRSKRKVRFVFRTG